MVTDLYVHATETNVDLFAQMASALGIDTIAAPSPQDADPVRYLDRVKIVRRVDLRGKIISALKTQTLQNRRCAVILAVPLRGVNTANWAAEDPRIDLLTVTSTNREHQLKTTTAHLAADGDTALEIPLRPLVINRGLDRSLILKAFREAVSVALSAGMQIVISSHARHPLEMRSGPAIEFVGTILELDRKYCRDAMRWADNRISRNEQRLDPDFIAPGLEVVRRGVHR